MGKSTAFTGRSLRQTVENIASEEDKSSRYSYVRDVLMNYHDGWTRTFPLEDSRFRRQHPFVTKPKAKQNLMEQEHHPKSFVPKSHSSYRNRLNGSNNAERLEYPTTPPEDRCHSPEQSDQARQVSVGTLPPVINELIFTEITQSHPTPASVQQSQLEAVETQKVDVIASPHDFTTTPFLLPLTGESPVIISIIVEMPSEQQHSDAVLDTSNDSVPNLQISITPERSFRLQSETLNSSIGPSLDQVRVVPSRADDSLAVAIAFILTIPMLQPEISTSTSVPPVPTTSMTLRWFIGMCLWGRQTGRKTEVYLLEIWPIIGSHNRFHLDFKGVRVKGFEMESFAAEPGTNANQNKVCVYGCMKGGKHQ